MVQLGHMPVGGFYYKKDGVLDKQKHASTV